MDTRRLIKKKPGFQVEAKSLEESLKRDLNLADDFALELYAIYDIFNATQEDIDLL